MDKIIYKRTSTGAIQQWQQEISGNSYRTISGQVGGSLVTSEWTVCKGKNIGRSNETTPAEQAEKEVEANYKKKLEQKGYHLTIAEIDNNKFFKPMLAREYRGELKFPVINQPKLDGLRMIVTSKGMFSRNGKEYKSCPHIFEELKPYLNKDPTLVFDGEIYNHELKHDFNTIVSLAKKQKPTEKDLKESAAKIQYHIYDLPSKEHFTARYKKLFKLVKETDTIKLVQTTVEFSQKNLDAMYEAFLVNGYEGQIIRLNGPYENKRSKYLLKRKPNNSDEFELVNIESGIGNYDGIAKKATLRLKDGRLFGAGITGSQQRNTQILIDKDKYIGKMTTVEYIGLTPDGIPRFGRVKEFNRDDN